MRVLGKEIVQITNSYKPFFVEKKKSSYSEIKPWHKHNSSVSGCKWPCPTLFIKLLALLLLIKDSLAHLFLVAWQSLRASYLPSYIERPVFTQQNDFLYLVRKFYATCLSIFASNVISGIFCHWSTQSVYHRLNRSVICGRPPVLISDTWRINHYKRQNLNNDMNYNWTYSQD